MNRKVAVNFTLYEIILTIAFFLIHNDFWPDVVCCVKYTTISRICLGRLYKSCGLSPGSFFSVYSIDHVWVEWPHPGWLGVYKRGLGCVRGGRLYMRSSVDVFFEWSCRPACFAVFYHSGYLISLLVIHIQQSFAASLTVSILTFARVLYICHNCRLDALSLRHLIRTFSQIYFKLFKHAW